MTQNKGQPFKTRNKSFNLLFPPLLFWQLLSVLVASAASQKRTDWPSLMQRLRREVVDLHSGQFCVDVSTYGDVVYEPTSREKCDTQFQKVCEDKSEQVLHTSLLN